MVIYVGFSGGGGGSLKVYDNSDLVGEFDSLNYITAADEVSIAPNLLVPGTLDIFHPATELASDWNDDNGSATGSGIPGPEGTSSRIVSTPTVEGTPFFTDGWAGTAHAVTRSNSVTYAPSGFVRFTDNTTTTFTIVLSRGATELYNEVTAPITGSGSFDTTTFGVTISAEQANGPGRMANVSISIPLSILFPSSGRVKIDITHNNIDVENTFTQEFFYDSQSSALTVGTHSVVLNTPVTYQTSGVHHLTTGSTWDWDVLDIDKVYADSLNEPPSAINAAAFAVAPFTNSHVAFGTTVWDVDDLNLNGTMVTNVTGVVTCGPATSLSTVTDWLGVNDTSLPLEILLCTESASTDYVETFRDEGYRLQTDLITPWDSTVVVSNEDLVVACGQLQRHGEDYTQFLPHDGGAFINPDYTLTGDTEQVYYRHIPDGGLARQNAIIDIIGMVDETLMTLDYTMNDPLTEPVIWHSITGDYFGGSLLDGSGSKTAGGVPYYTFTMGIDHTTVGIILRIRMTADYTFTGINFNWI